MKFIPKSAEFLGRTLLLFSFSFSLYTYFYYCIYIDFAALNMGICGNHNKYFTTFEFSYMISFLFLNLFQHYLLHKSDVIVFPILYQHYQNFNKISISNVVCTIWQCTICQNLDRSVKHRRPSNVVGTIWQHIYVLWLKITNSKIDMLLFIQDSNEVILQIDLENDFKRKKKLSQNLEITHNSIQRPTNRS